MEKLRVGYFINIIIIIVETITIYMYNGEKIWLFVMLVTMLGELVGGIKLMKKEK